MRCLRIAGLAISWTVLSATAVSAAAAGLAILLWGAPTAQERAAAAGLADAAEAGDIAAVRALLEAGADANAPQADGTTPLHWTAYRDDAAAAELLIGAGADVNARMLVVQRRIRLQTLWTEIACHRRCRRGNVATSVRYQGEPILRDGTSGSV